MYIKLNHLATPETNTSFFKCKKGGGGDYSKVLSLSILVNSGAWNFLRM